MTNENTSEIGERGEQLKRRSFLGAVGAASATQIGGITDLADANNGLANTHYVEATVEFDFSDENVHVFRPTPDFKLKPSYSKGAVARLVGLADEEFRRLVQAETAVFGLESLRSAPATFEPETLRIVPAKGSMTPRPTRAVEVEEPVTTPEYQVSIAEQSDDETAVITTDSGEYRVEEGGTRRIALDTHTLSPRSGTEDAPDEVTVESELVVGNFGSLDVFDAGR